MNGPELYSIARDFLDKEFNMKLDIPIFISPKLKTTFGYFRTKKGVAWEIQMSKEFMDTHPREHIIDVLKHELVHYACFEMKKPWRDKDPYFKETLDRLGVCRTRTYHTLGKFHVYICDGCGNTYYKKRKLSATTKCSCYKGPLIYFGTQEKELH